MRTAILEVLIFTSAKIFTSHTSRELNIYIIIINIANNRDIKTLIVDMLILCIS